jgi:predicted TIM-barrel fold metal-dependent hydrolase
LLTNPARTERYEADSRSAVQERPDRFAGFASLKLKQPEQPARELVHVRVHKSLKGLLVDGLNGGGLLYEPKFTPIFEAAQSLGVPLYRHASPPPRGLFDAYFATLPSELAIAWRRRPGGWLAELGPHALRIITPGGFDWFPRQQIMIGHMSGNSPLSVKWAD